MKLFKKNHLTLHYFCFNGRYTKGRHIKLIDFYLKTIFLPLKSKVHFIQQTENYCLFIWKKKYWEFIFYYFICYGLTIYFLLFYFSRRKRDTLRLLDAILLRFTLFRLVFNYRIFGFFWKICFLHKVATVIFKSIPRRKKITLCYPEMVENAPGLGRKIFCILILKGGLDNFTGSYILVIFTRGSRKARFGPIHIDNLPERKSSRNDLSWCILLPGARKGLTSIRPDISDRFSKRHLVVKSWYL